MSTTPKFDAFVSELKDLCRKHGVQIAVSGYDALQVWPLDNGESELYVNDLEDHTE